MVHLLKPPKRDAASLTDNNASMPALSHTSMHFQFESNRRHQLLQQLAAYLAAPPFRLGARVVRVGADLFPPFRQEPHPSSPQRIRSRRESDDHRCQLLPGWSCGPSALSRTQSTLRFGGAVTRTCVGDHEGEPCDEISRRPVCARTASKISRAKIG